MKSTVLVLLALLALVLAWFLAPDAAQVEVTRPRVAAKTPVHTAPPPVRTGDAPVQRAEKVSPQSCEIVATQGAHVASTVEDARSGAAEDVRDVCPSSVLTQVLENCSERLIPNAEGLMERQYRCEQSGDCRICGDDLARRNEVLDERKN